MPKQPHEEEADNRPEEEEDDDIEEYDGDETVVMSDADADEEEDLDISMEVNVEKLIAEIDKTEVDDIERRKQIRRRLEEIQEQRSIEDTYSFDLYGDD